MLMATLFPLYFTYLKLISLIISYFILIFQSRFKHKNFYLDQSLVILL